MGPVNTFGMIGIMQTLGLIIVYGMGNIGVMLFYRRFRRESFSVWLHGVIPVLTTAAMMRVVSGARPGMSELEAAAQLGYAGGPLTCNVMLSADDTAVVGLRSRGADHRRGRRHHRCRRALNCEDTVAIADGALRGELGRDHPELWERIRSRRRFIRDELGIDLAEDVLRLSDSVGYLAPFWLDPSLVCAVNG